MIKERENEINASSRSLRDSKESLIESTQFDTRKVDSESKIVADIQKCMTSAEGA